MRVLKAEMRWELQRT